MARTVSVAELAHGGASRAIRDVQHGPVLVSKENRPAAWIVSAEKLAQVAAARGVELDVYERTLELLAVELYRDGTLTLGQASKLSALPLADFIDLCAQLHVPILWEPKGGLQAEVDAFSDLLEDATSEV